MQFIDEHDDLPGRVRDDLQDFLQSFLEFAPVFGSGYKRSQIKRIEGLVLQGFRHVACHDPAGQPFDDSSLADARLTDQDRVVLLPAGKDLDRAADLVITADDRIQCALAGFKCQILPVLFQGLLVLFRILAALVAVHETADRRTGDPVLPAQGHGFAVAILTEGRQQMCPGDLVLAGGLLRQCKSPGKARGQAQLVRSLDGRDLFQGMVQIPAELVLIRMDILQDKMKKVVRLAVHGCQKMQAADLLVVIHDGLLLSSLHQAFDFFTVTFYLHHKHLLKRSSCCLSSVIKGNPGLPVELGQQVLYTCLPAKEAFMHSSIILYHLFDVADEINLKMVEAIWAARNKIASRLRFDKSAPESISIKNPPVLVELGTHDMTFAGKEYTATINARIYDIGVVSLIFHIELPETITESEFTDLAIAVDTLPEDTVREYIKAVTDTIRPACTRMRISDFDEDFVVYYFRDPLPDWDYPPIMMKDRTPLSEETRKDVMANHFSYSTGDVIYLTWDTALLYDSTGSMDLPDLLEFANAQFLELRYYDDALRQAIERTYDDIDEAGSPDGPSRLRAFRQIRTDLMEVMADMSVLTSNVDNALQVTEDVFNARVYARFMELLHADVWRENISTKLRVLERIYGLFNTEVILRRFSWKLQAIIILLGVLLIITAVTFLARA